MNQPSKAGTAILVLFAIPFMGMGAGLMMKLQSAGGPNSLPGSIFAGSFVAIGALMMIVTICGFHRLKQLDRLREQNPNAPWLWREDWAQSRSQGENRNRATLLWIATGVGSSLTLPWVFIGLNHQGQKGNPPAFLLIGFASFSVILAIAAIIATIRRDKFGKTFFEFDSLPIAPGRKLTGRLHVRLDSNAQHGVDLRLRCVRRITTGSGKSQSTRDETLWEQQQNVAANAFNVDPLGATVPVAFDIPADSYESNYENLNDKILWLLHAKVDVPGVDFSEDYEIPVFNTGDAVVKASSSASSAAVFENSFGGGTAVAAPPAIHTQNEPVAKPETISAIISTDWNGTQYYFPPLRNPMQTLALFGFTAAWSGIVYVLYHAKGTAFFTFVFGAIDLGLILGILNSLFSRARIQLGSDTLTLRKSIIGFPSTTSISFSDIATIVPIASGQQAGKGGAWHSLRLTKKNGRFLTLVGGISNRQEAQWLVSQLESSVGLQQDTHVEFDVFSDGGYGPPPRRGAPASEPARPAIKPSPWMIVVFMLVWVSIFGIGIFRTFTRTAPVKARKPAQAQQILPRTFTQLTEKDVERIFSLPLQDQAEELLERSIQHDDRARDLLEKHIAGWKSQVKETPRMKQLLNRAQYSRDLRVRGAYCGMMLAMDGWNENSEAVQILVQRAKDDPASRTYDVWFLGMLGGRGVEPEQVHTVLLDYARNDPDAGVRQWATEGMRFLGSDQALDDLFAIYVSDPSFSVRDRAGCNVSDCGNFMRKQRLRMLPKFLELTDNPATNAQMRNWSFLAMQEITDVRLPADSAAWRHWYTRHGAEKMAQFESIPEWQVRGDE